MSKIKKYAIDTMGEDGFQAFLDDQMKGDENDKCA